MSAQRHDYAQAAKILGTSERWLRRNISRLPHKKRGREVRFTDADLERIDALTHHEPTTGPLAAASTAAPTSGPHPLSHLRPLPRRGGALKNVS